MGYCKGPTTLPSNSPSKMPTPRASLEAELPAQCGQRGLGGIALGGEQCV